MRQVILLMSCCGTAWCDNAKELQLASVGRQMAVIAAMNESLRLQETSVRKQIRVPDPKENSFFLVGDQTQKDAATAECQALTTFEARGMVEHAARNAGIDPNLLQAVASQESAFRPCALSVKGAQGLMQLMPNTAAELGVRNPFDPAESLAGGAALLKQLLTRYSGDLNRVLGAYNAGPARVDAAGGVPAIPETVDYVERILGKLP